MTDQVIGDVRHAWRAILRMPVLAAVVVVSLAVGIGVNTAVFSWLQAVVPRPLPGVPDISGFQFVETRADTVLLLVATVACWIPARRAAAVDPMVALRQE